MNKNISSSVYITEGKTCNTIKNGFGFIIVYPTEDPANLAVTTGRIKSEFPEVPVKLIVPVGFCEKDSWAARGIKIESYSNTVTGLINYGVSKSERDWNFILVPGNLPTINLVKKYLYFCQNIKDVLYPITGKHWSFERAPLGGLFFNRTINPPKFPEKETDFVKAKMIWAGVRTLYGSQIKGIVGGKF